MDLMSRDFSGDSKEMACYDRPLCHQAQQPTPSLLFTSSGPYVPRSGCNASSMGQFHDVCFPSLRNDTSSLGEAQSFQQYHDDSNSPHVASASMVSRSFGSTSGDTCVASTQERSSQTTSFPQVSSEPPRAAPNCLETIQQSARHLGFSKGVAKQLAFCRRSSTRMNYQAKWVVFRQWCRSQGHSISRPSISKIADFLLFLRKVKKLSYSSIAGYRTMLSATFQFILPEISESTVLKNLLRSFKIERPISQSRVPPWDLARVLAFLRSPAFEPLASLDLRQLTKKVLFLVSLATARRVGELQAVSSLVSFKGNVAYLSYLPEFLAKTENEGNQLPRYFELKSLSDFVGNLEEELLLCPVRALRVYLNRTSQGGTRPRNLFVSPKCPFRGISKNAISYFLREVISEAQVQQADPGPSVQPRAHSVRGMATSSAFLRNSPVAKVLEAATWKSSLVFTSFYLKDVQFDTPDGFSLGPCVAANAVI